MKARKELTVTIPGNDNLAVEAHIRNFLNSCRGTEKPIAPPQALATKPPSPASSR